MDVICINCGSNDTTHFLTSIDNSSNTHDFKKCNNCGLIFLLNSLNDKDISKIYNEDYYGTDDKEKFNNKSVVNLISYFSSKRAKSFTSFLNNGDRIMDVGCGNGRFLEFLYKSKKKFELHGIEIQAKAALRATSRLKAKAWIHTVTQLEKFFGKNSFNAVTYIHVFEHLINPAEVLDELKNVIRKDGKILIVIPNIESWQFKLFKSKWFHLDTPRHINFYSLELINKEMSDRGFRLVKFKNFDFEQGPFGFIQSFFNLFTKKSDLLFESLKGNKPKDVKSLNFKLLIMKIFLVLLFPFALIFELLASVFHQGATLELIYSK